DFPGVIGRRLRGWRAVAGLARPAAAGAMGAPWRVPGADGLAAHPLHADGRGAGSVRPLARSRARSSRGRLGSHPRGFDGDWDGGYSPPPRYLVVVAPLLVVPLALTLRAAGETFLAVPTRAVVAFLALWSALAASYPFRDSHIQFFELDAASPILAGEGRDIR